MRAERVIIVKPYASPIGVLLLGSFEDRLCLCDWRTTAEHGRRMDERLQTRLSATYLEGTSEMIETTQSQLEEYFAGKRTAFQIPLLLSGTDFQRSVWKELLQIPYGSTQTYKELAISNGVYGKNYYRFPTEAPKPIRSWLAVSENLLPSVQ